MNKKHGYFLLVIFIALILQQLVLISTHMYLTFREIKPEFVAPSQLIAYRFTNNNDFPTPKFHGCSPKKRLCKFSNVCFSGIDGMLVFDVPGLHTEIENATEGADAPWFSEEGEFGTRHVTAPRIVKLVNKTRYSTLRNVHFSKSMFAFNCWRQSERSYNPAHLLMGIGKLFVHSIDRTNSEPFDTVLFHQCPSTTGWAWGQYVKNIIWDYAIKSGAISKDVDTQDAQINLPHKGVLEDNDMVVCGETVYQEPFSVALYLGRNNHDDIVRWRNVLEEHLNNTYQEPFIEKPSSTHITNNNTRYNNTCASKLKFAAWRRTEGSALRRFTNMDDIKLLVGKYSSIPLSVISVSSTTPPEEQVKLFRSSFDVLMTPHGSHNANMIFSPYATAFIEIAAVPFDKAPFHNGKSFVKKWTLSYGHLPFNNTNLVKKMKNCSNEDRDVCNKYTRLLFIQSDLVVNVEILQKNLEHVISVLCPVVAT